MPSTRRSPAAGDPAPAGQEERRREQRSWYAYDWASSGYVTTTATVLLVPYLTAVARAAACPGLPAGATCRRALSVLGVPVAPASLALYAVTATTVLSALVLPVVGALADRSSSRRRLLAGFGEVGAAAACAMVLITGTAWQLGVVLQVVAGTMLGCSLVVYDALLCDVALPEERDRVSSRGWALGYLGGALLLTLDLALVTGAGALGIASSTAVRLSLLSAGLWWAVFTVVPYRGLPDRPPVGPGGGRGVARGAFGQLVATVRHARGYPQTLLFLLAYLFFNDGIQTVVGVASTYGQEELGLRSSQLIVAILLVQFVAFGGALAFGRAAARFGAQRSVLAGLGLWGVVVAVGFFLPRGAFAPFLALGVLIGLVLGGTQALSRSLYSRLVPRGREAEYFSLYQAGERGTSWLGTLAFGVVAQVSGSYRAAIVALVVFFLVGGLLLARVDVPRGVREAAGETATAV